MRAPDPSVARVAARLQTRVKPLAGEITNLIAEQIDFYRSGSIITRADLRRSVEHNLSYMLGQLARPEPPDLSAPRETGRLRAEQGAPLPEILRVYRLGFAFLWERLLAEARHSADDALHALLDTATGIWELADDYSLALTEAYRQAMTTQMISADRRRSALVAALINGSAGDRDTAWEVARLLDFPYDGHFLVVVAETATLGADTLPGLEDRLRVLDVASAWRTQPDFAVAVLSYGRRRTAGTVIDAVGDTVTHRAGISPEYLRLDQTPRATRFARAALESMSAETKGARQLDDTPLGELVMGSLDTTRRVVQRILHDVLTLPDEDRSTLLSTPEAWLDAHGSAADAGRTLYCHENTVRYRLHKLEEHLGRALDDPVTIAELATALKAVRTFPSLGARMTGAPPS